MVLDSSMTADATTRLLIASFNKGKTSHIFRTHICTSGIWSHPVAVSMLFFLLHYVPRADHEGKVGVYGASGNVSSCAATCDGFGFLTLMTRRPQNQGVLTSIPCDSYSYAIGGAGASSEGD